VPNSSGDVGVGENELKRALHARRRRNDEVTDKITALQASVFPCAHGYIRGKFSCPMEQSATPMGPKLREYDDRPSPLLCGSLHAEWRLRGLREWGDVPAGSSFINEVGIPVVFQVPWGKTNK
jgi:hypothetical protein